MMVAVLLLIILLAGYVFYYKRLSKLNAVVNLCYNDIILCVRRRHQLIINILNAIPITKDRREEITYISSAITQIRNIKTLERAEKKMNLPIQEIYFLTERTFSQTKNFELSQLKRSLRRAEENLDYACENYNIAVREFNIALHTIPTSWIASSQKVRERSFFDNM